MSQGPFGLTAALVCWAIVKVAPIKGTASAIIRARLILVIILILVPCRLLFRGWQETECGLCLRRSNYCRKRFQRRTYAHRFLYRHRSTGAYPSRSLR